MRKTLNALLICGSFSISNAQTVLDALEPVPYKIEEDRKETIHVPASTECRSPEYVNMPKIEYTITRKYQSFSWDSYDDAMRKIDEHFGTTEKSKETTAYRNRSCRRQAWIQYTWYVSYNTEKLVNDSTDYGPCPMEKKAEYYEGRYMPDYYEYRREYGWGPTFYAKYEPEKERYDQPQKTGKGLCTDGGVVWYYQWREIKSVDYDSGYQQAYNDYTSREILK